MRWSSQKTILFEVALIKLCNQEESKKIDSPDLEDIYDRINKLEEKIKTGDFSKTSSEKITEKEGKNIKINNVPKPKIEKVTDLKIDKLDFWPKIIENLKEQRKMMLVSNLLNTVATSLNDLTVGIVFQNGLTPFVKSIMEKPENIQELTRLVSIECGKQMTIKLLDYQDEVLQKKLKEKNPEEQVKEELDVPVNVIED